MEETKLYDDACRDFALNAINYLFNNYFVDTIKLEKNPNNEHERIMRFTLSLFDESSKLKGEEELAVLLER